MTRIPSCVRRRPVSFFNRIIVSGGRAREWCTSKRSWTAVATLLTFCPPGPDAWMNSKVNAFSSIDTDGVIWIMELISSHLIWATGELDGPGSREPGWHRGSSMGRVSWLARDWNVGILAKECQCTFLLPQSLDRKLQSSGLFFPRILGENILQNGLDDAPQLIDGQWTP